MATKQGNCCKKCLICCTITIFLLLLLTFLIVFVFGPLYFKNNVDMQRNFIFHTENGKYIGGTNKDIESYGLKGIRNFYVTVNEKENITLGVWQILPMEYIVENKSNALYDYNSFLKDDTYHMLLYLHGNGGVRAMPVDTYNILRKDFQIIACDYRGYSDSSKAEITEDGVVNDTVSLFKWLKSRTKAKIFIWGHSLGTAIGTHVASKLKNEDVTLTGLILENPFTRVTDVVPTFSITNYFSWLPWFKTMFLDPFDEHGFGFHTDEHILNVNCPIMILHAKDDVVIPFELAVKLNNTAVQNRNATAQGPVTFHLFEALGYSHWGICEAPELPAYLRKFINECVAFEEKNLRKKQWNRLIPFS